MNPYPIAVAWAWQESWDRQQEAYLPDREHRIAVMLDAVEATCDTASPRLLDLAGGTGSIALRALARFPGAEITLIDLDPVLLAIAAATLAERAAADQVAVVHADLNRSDWVSTLPHRRYDAVLTATALHWLPAERLTVLYAELRDVLRSGGLLVNADHMPDDGLPELTKRLHASAEARRTARLATGAALSWRDWWQRLSEVPEFAPLIEQRNAVYPEEHRAEWAPPASWHVAALRAAGYAEAGVLWRGGTDAAVAAVR